MDLGGLFYGRWNSHRGCYSYWERSRVLAFQDKKNRWEAGNSHLVAVGNWGRYSGRLFEAETSIHRVGSSHIFSFQIFGFGHSSKLLRLRSKPAFWTGNISQKHLLHGERLIWGMQIIRGKTKGGLFEFLCLSELLRYIDPVRFFCCSAVIKLGAVILPDNNFGSPGLGPAAAFDAAQDIRNFVRAGFMCGCEKEKNRQQR